ncbi:hypothetical protein PsYK624_078990 [Phanerochaete sordida]|uniref:Integral membrane protein n=1 Tax=Phanerochaete sordida TaxID=48140 RepID=A0A9P3GBB6_9APHY|nr:hypothetical protein PsYK624_078990 [Phanerochaete sordida]
MSVHRPTPPWPSLYNFWIEIEPIQHRDPVQSRGRYLYNSNDIFRFTLYWTLIFYTPAFFLCGTYAFLNLAFTPQSRVRRYLRLTSSEQRAQDALPLQKLHSASLSPADGFALTLCRAKHKRKERRSRLTFALLVALTFACTAVGGAVVGSAVLGYVMAGLFRAARFNMSTWIPFLVALMQTLVGYLSLWPTVVDII